MKQGTVKQLISLNDHEGAVILAEVCHGYLICATNLTYLRLFDLTRR
ncbi:unnamed protein product [Protopolystoma xenopodis]|uniref:IFT140 second beta-propeller domain-containing protein n=1 Tax=Protopolystoma xenopodis TaxID=117903 RepID=A0A3S5CIX6_9PLAT|nr:unnamed protein product [Protopolystoma xenopodis]